MYTYTCITAYEIYQEKKQINFFYFWMNETDKLDSEITAKSYLIIYHKT